MLTVLHPGLLTTLQDRGRAGSAHLGIGTSGAADLPALRLANALVGNPEDACALECTLLGPALRVDRDACIALTGAPLPRARIDGVPLPQWCPVFVASGARIEVGAMSAGCRSYLAVAGGIDVPAWRGSRATDVNSGLGPLPRPLTAGDRLTIGRIPALTDVNGKWSLDSAPWFDNTTPRGLRLLPGTHAHQLDDPSSALLTSQAFTVRGDSNRVGVRLDGPRLKLSSPLELTSEGLVAGTVQLPPDGQPIIMGPEHPVTGGYPRIGQVIAVDLPRLAQCRPGDTVTFERTDMAAALALLTQRDEALERLIRDIHTRIHRT